MKFYYLFFSLVLVAKLAFSQVDFSKSVNTNWPYLFEQYVPAKVFFDGESVSETKINVELARNIYHILDDKEVVREFNRMVDIDSVVVNNELIFLRFNDEVFQQIASSKEYRLVLKRVADLSGLDDGGAYGSSTSSSAVTEITSLYVTNNSNMHIGKVRKERENGRKFPVRTSTYIYNKSDGSMERASKKGFQNLFGKDKVKDILKKEKLKLGNDDDIILLFQKCTK